MSNSLEAEKTISNYVLYKDLKDYVSSREFSLLNNISFNSHISWNNRDKKVINVGIFAFINKVYLKDKYNFNGCTDLTYWYPKVPFFTLMNLDPKTLENTSYVKNLKHKMIEGVKYTYVEPFIKELLLKGEVVQIINPKDSSILEYYDDFREINGVLYGWY